MGQVRLAIGAVVNRFFVIPRFQCGSGDFLPPPELIKSCLGWQAGALQMTYSKLSFGAAWGQKSRGRRSVADKSYPRNERLR
jgi:hypothetical protein